MTRRFVPYRRDLKSRAQTLRRDPSPAERRLWYEFLRMLPQRFTRQKPLGRYIADFYCSSHQLVIELDGDSHYTERAQRYDERRTADLEMERIRVVRISNAEVMQNFEEVCTRIMQTLKPKT